MKVCEKCVPYDAIKFEYSDDGINQLLKFCGRNNVKRIVTETHPTLIQYATIDCYCGGDYSNIQPCYHGDYVIKDQNGQLSVIESDYFDNEYYIVEE